MEFMLGGQRSKNVIIGGVILAASLLCLFGLNKGAFWDYDEGIYAQVTRDTLKTEDVLSLKMGDSTWFEKPPLYFWAAMVSGKVFQSKEFAYRLPAAMSGIVSIILVILIVLSLTENYLIACLAGVILLTSPTFLEAARQYRLDVPVTAAILFSFYSFLKGLKNDKWLLGVGVGIGIGVMIKSVIGFFPIIAILMWAITYRDISWLKNKYFLLGALLSLVVVVPWHIYESVQYGMKFWNPYLFFHVVDRFQENVLNITVKESNSVYLSLLFSYALPWTVVFMIMCPFLYWLNKNKQNVKDIIPFVLFAFCVTGLFFMAGTKINYYLTPIYPFIAISIALTVDKIYKSTLNLQKFRSMLPAIIGVLLIIALGNTIYVGFNKVHQFYINQVVSDDERNAGILIAKDKENLGIFSYKYEYWDTVRYYADRPIQSMTDDQILDKPFFLLMHTESGYGFPDELKNAMKVQYSGPSLTLYKFVP